MPRRSAFSPNSKKVERGRVSVAQQVYAAVMADLDDAGDAAVPPGGAVAGPVGADGALIGGVDEQFVDGDGADIGAAGVADSCGDVNEGHGRGVLVIGGPGLVRLHRRPCRAGKAGGEVVGVEFGQALVELVVGKGGFGQAPAQRKRCLR